MGILISYHFWKRLRLQSAWRKWPCFGSRCSASRRRLVKVLEIVCYCSEPSPQVEDENLSKQEETLALIGTALCTDFVLRMAAAMAATSLAQTHLKVKSDLQKLDVWLAAAKEFSVRQARRWVEASGGRPGRLAWT